MDEPAPADGHLDATRRSYDIVAGAYADLLADHPDHTPLEWALLDVFAQRIVAAGGGPAVEVGCGPGRVTVHLAALGMDDVRGVDLSPAMIAEARRRHPQVPFEVGSFTALDADDETFAGVLSWYSIVHTPPDELPAVFAELHRVLRPGGVLLVGFKVGDGATHLRAAYGHDGLDLDVRRFPIEWLADLLGDAGLHVDTRVVREPTGPEGTPQGFLLAPRPL